MRASLLAPLLLIALVAGAQRQTPLDVSHGGGGGGVPAGTPRFSQSGSTLTIYNCSAGQSVLYRTDGGYVTIASTLYSAPIAVTTGEVVSAICATVGAQQANTQASSTGTSCQTVAGGGYTGPPSITCTSSGGGITGNPSNVVMSFGSPATLTITAPSGQSGQTQALLKFLYSGSADPGASRCDTCSEHVKDIKFTVIGAGMANQEHDSPWYNNTYGYDAQNGFQCEGYGTGAILEVDSGNAGGTWTPTIVPCSTWTAGTTHEIIESVTDQWTSTACTGGTACAHYNYAVADGTYYGLGGTYGNTQGFHTQTGETAWGWQFQPDLAPTGGSAVTAGWTVISATVALGTGDESAPQSYTAL